MVSNRLSGILQHLLGRVRPPAEQNSDAHLLELYLRRRDEAAFESLLLRHGPLVLGVCRRILVNEQDAEDAFQATFLVLLRKAASVKKRASLASWLYGVAQRTAREARRALARRRAREARTVPREKAAARDDDLREVLDRELAALPERYRAAVVLCDLEGRERKEAARELGCPEGTVASRLARGRLLLARRLARHGLTASALAAVSRQTPASVPAALVSATVRSLATGPGAAGAISANVSFLVERVVRNMLMVKLRAVTAVALLVGVVGTGAGWLYYHREAAAQPSAASAEVDPPPGQGDRPTPKPGGRQQTEQAKGLDELLADEEKSRPALLKSEPIKVDREDDEMQRLLKEGYNEALATLSLRYQGFVVGRQMLSQVFDAGAHVLRAGLELKEKPEERIALLAQYLEVMKAVEKIMDTRFQQGRVGMADLREARYHRIRAEIELLRLKRKAK